MWHDDVVGVIDPANVHRWCVFDCHLSNPPFEKVLKKSGFPPFSQKLKNS